MPLCFSLLAQDLKFFHNALALRSDMFQVHPNTIPTIFHRSGQLSKLKGQHLFVVGFQTFFQSKAEISPFIIHGCLYFIQDS